jgi:hypothetical protein
LVAQRIPEQRGHHPRRRKPQDPETAIARADEAMYAEKHARRAQTAAFAAF